MRVSKATTIARQGGTSLLFLAFLLLAATLAVGGCNTVSGVGEDVEAAGKGIDQTSERTQERIRDSGKSGSSQQRSQSDDYQAGRY
jgi:predicted small secreted protein